ncbi:MAG: SpoIIIAH-like family protein [Ruminiclostridium sp.]|nr:SpoIIIAH-like family protein [Ruminiclostridium sp.]
MKFGKRLNIIIGRKQIAAAGLAVLLGTAVYVNYLYSAKPVKTAETESAAETGKSGTSTYGEVLFVDADTSAGELSISASQSDEYFAQARLDKQKSRDESIEVLQSFYYGGDSTAEELAVISEDVRQVSSCIETESRVENLLRAQGFADALCYLTDSSANIVVKTEGLDNAQAAQIKSTLLGEIAVPAENITIVEIK